MENQKISTFLSLLAFFFFFLSNPLTATDLSKNILSSRQPEASHLQTYIVHVEKPKNTVFASSRDQESWHKSFLPMTIASSSSDPRMVYSYRNVISGFAARLTAQEVKAMEQKEGFVQAYPDRLVRLQTTRTPKFLGLQLQQGFLKNSNYGKGVIIGVLDGGVLPTHPSFSDYGMPPPPSKWKGRCEFNASDCNNKIIGARAFLSGAMAMKGGAATASMSPIDEDGHGTHTASTAAGAFVKDAEVLGNGKGTAVGMAPLAHLAIYRVCSIEDCADSDIFAGLDAAVEDGVDVLSISLGSDSAPFFKDVIAIASFGAMEKGIFISCAGGNSGPTPGTITNEAPWILTVAASTMDRTIRATVKLGNGVELNGESVFQPSGFSASMMPLVYAGASGKQDAFFCGNGSLDGIDVKGKIVLCERGGGVGRIDKGSFVLSAGGAGMILMNQEPHGFSTEADTNVLPASHVSFSDGSKIKAYINSSNYSPTATIIFKGTIVGTSPAPAMTSFSSRGPSLATPGILKPDITGPGVNVLAAWPFQVGPALANSNSSTTFNIISGTSMSCPHLSGIAALIKSAHPYWSPAAIKSAIMTTSDVTDRYGMPILDERLLPADFFAMGAGHVNPTKANDPGLVYDLHVSDYISYLCGLNYTSAQVGVITRSRTDCSIIKSISEGELNYPSIMVSLGPMTSYVTLKRTVKNVGEANSTYWAKVDMMKGVSVSVEPKMLQFCAVNEEKSFTLTFTKRGGVGMVSEGNLRWVSNKRVVRSPISVSFE